MAEQSYEERLVTALSRATLITLPWVKTSKALPELHKHSVKRFLVVTAPVVGGTGRLSAEMHFAFYRGDGRWEWCGAWNIDQTKPVDGTVVGWLDVTHWDLDWLAEALQADDAGEASDG